jgi:hypothetical protein
VGEGWRGKGKFLSHRGRNYFLASQRFTFAYSTSRCTGLAM